ncbi:MAG: fibronectin type III domain-containing protein [Candidatus Kapaibacterium sp.]
MKDKPMITEGTRKYLLSDAELTTFAAQLLTYIRRDIQEFTLFGVTPAKIDELEALREEFMNFPSDASFVTKAILAKEHRASARERLLNSMSHVTLRFEMAFGAGDTKLKELENDELGKQSEDTILNRARHFKAAIEQYAGELEEFGQTAEATAEFSATILAFEQAVIAVKEANKARTSNTADRIAKGNEFYVKLTHYTDMGKKVFRKNNPQKLADYIIYGAAAPVGVHGAPTNLRFTGNDLLEWDEIDNAVSYAVAVSSDGGVTWSKDVTTSDNFYSLPTTPEGKYLYKVRGRNAKGYGEYSEVMEKEFGSVEAVMVPS